MANKGLQHVVFAKKITGGYANLVHISPAARVAVTMTKAEGNDYGDDRLVDTESQVTGADIEVELNHDEKNIYNYLLGHVDTSTGYETQFAVDDDPPVLGMGFLVKSRVTSGTVWVGTVFKEVKFSEPNITAQTKAESVNFQHITIPGKMLIPEDGTYKIRKEFTTASAAVAWIDGKLGGDVLVEEDINP